MKKKKEPPHIYSITAAAIRQNASPFAARILPIVEFRSTSPRSAPNQRQAPPILSPLKKNDLNIGRRKEKKRGVHYTATRHTSEKCYSDNRTRQLSLCQRVNRVR